MPHIVLYEMSGKSYARSAPIKMAGILELPPPNVIYGHRDDRFLENSADFSSIALNATWHIRYFTYLLVSCLCPLTPQVSTRKGRDSPVLRLHFQNEQKIWKEGGTGALGALALADSLI